MQRIFSSAGAFGKILECTVNVDAPGELKISCAKPRAYGGSMGIESAGDVKCCLLGKVRVEDRCALQGADQLRCAVAVARRGGAGAGDLPGAWDIVVGFL
jgi:hypothetical protein